MDKETLAYYAGKNDVWAGEEPKRWDEFETKGEYEQYCRGRKHAKAEDRLDRDEEWN